MAVTVTETTGHKGNPVSSKAMESECFNHNVEHRPILKRRPSFSMVWCFHMNDNYAEPIQILADKILLAAW